MSSFLTALPDELITQILVNLNAKSLLQCRSACQLLYHVVRRSSALQYIIELRLHGLQDTGSSLYHSELITRLRAHQAKWDSIEWWRVTTIPMREQCIAYELVGGVFANAMPHELVFLKLPDNRIGQREEGSEYGWTITRWTFEDITIRDLTIDPSQDLAVIFEDIQDPILVTSEQKVRLQLRTISTNEPHPLATQSSLTFTLSPLALHGIYTTLIQVMDEIISMFFCRGANAYRPRIIIWNWKQGFTVYDSECWDFPLPPSTCHFTPLTRTTFITTCTLNQGSIHLFTFSPVSNSTTPRLLAIFLLPEIHPRYEVQELTVHGGPAEGRFRRGDLFTSIPEDSLLVVTIKYQHRGQLLIHNADDALVFSIYVHAHVLLRYASAADAEVLTSEAQMQGNQDSPKGIPLPWSGRRLSAIKNTQNRTIPWNNWGPPNTRFLPSKTPMNWMRYVHGQRIVLRTGTSDLNVVDLAPINYTLSTSSSSSQASPDSSSKSSRHTGDLNERNNYVSPPDGSHTTGFVHIKPSDIRRQYLFSDSVVTYLPMRVSTRNMPALKDFNAWMIDGTRIVGVKVDELSGEVKEVRVYSF